MNLATGIATAFDHFGYPDLKRQEFVRMKKIFMPMGALCFLCVANACFVQDECGPTGSGCDGSTMVWCENGDYENPLYYDCAEDGLTCARLNSEMPECVMECSGSEEGKVFADGCVDDYHVNLYECIHNGSHDLFMSNPGTSYYYDNRSERCEHGCDPGLGDCIFWHPDEYLPCSDDYIPSCQGDVLGFCGNDHTVHAYDCYAEGKTCGIVNGAAECADLCDPATFKESTECITEGDRAFERTIFCSEYGYVDFEDYPCPYGCFNEENRCSVHADEGKSCAAGASLCIDDKTVLECVDGKLTWQAFSCQENQICLHLQQDYGTCLDRCTKADTTFKCLDSKTSELSTCAEIDGNLVISEVDTLDCEFGCSPDFGSCKISKHEGEPCTSGNQCDGNVLLYCANKKLAALECGIEDKVCAHDSENHFGCMPSCTKAGVTTTCSEDGKYSDHEICTEQGGVHALELQSFYCEHGCLASTGECKVDGDEGNTCDETYTAKCSGPHLTYCDDKTSKIAHIDCSKEESRTCAVIDEQAQCAPTCDPAAMAEPQLSCATKDDKAYSVTTRCVFAGTQAHLETSEEFCEFGCDDKTHTCKGAPELENSEKWIGSPCTCEGAGCEMAGIPLPAPPKDATIVGCDNVETDITGAANVCLRTIPNSQSTVCPPVYFPQGYCALAATGCTGSAFCSTVTFGDVSQMTTCPKGSTLLEATFHYAIAGQDSVITSKTCAQSCKSDADCHGEMKCLTKDDAHFCYDELNFAFMDEGYTATPF